MICGKKDMINTQQLLTSDYKNQPKKTFCHTTFDMRADFRNELKLRYVENNPTLPIVEKIESIPVLDDETIVGLNLILSPDKRTDLIESIIFFQYYQEMAASILNNSNINLKGYIHKILVDSSNSEIISEYDLYSIGNLFLYTISGMDIDRIQVKDVIENFRELMYTSNKTQLFNSLFFKENNYHENLNKLSLLTDSQLNDQVRHFNSEIDNKIAITRKRFIYGGFKLLTSILLTSMGIPPFFSRLFVSKVFSYTLTSSCSPNLQQQSTISTSSLNSLEN